MKQSEILKQQAQAEENDLKAIGIYTKVMRQERAERFEDYKNTLLAEGYNLDEYEAQGKITISPTEYGIVDYYPKANKILIREQNKWHKAGLRWIRNHLLNGI